MYKKNSILIWTGISLLISNLLIFGLWIFEITFHGYVNLSPSLSRAIMTIDSVFTGFSYTTLGNMVSFSISRKVVQVDSDGYLDKYYNGVYITILLFILAIGVGCLTGFSVLGMNNHWLFIIQFLLNLDAFVYFMLSVIGFRNLINWIRAEIRKVKD